jgi:hypothetical protein
MIVSNYFCSWFVTFVMRFSWFAWKLNLICVSLQKVIEVRFVLKKGSVKKKHFLVIM